MSIRSEIIHAQHYQQRYLFFHPQGKLGKLVDCFWQLNPSVEEVGERNFANLSASLVFNLGSSFVYENAKTKERQSIQQNCLIGLRTQAAIFEHQADNYLFGIKFRPVGWAHFLGIHPQELKNQVLDFKSIFVQHRLHNILRPNFSFQEKIERILPILMDTFDRENRASATVKAAIQLFKQQFHQEMRVGNYARQLYVSPKTLKRHFNQVLGINPKECLSIIRLRAALAKFSTDRQSFSVYDYAYTDYSHFLKTVYQYTQTRPWKLL